MLDELKREMDSVAAEKDARTRALEEQLAQLRGGFWGEKQQRAVDSAELREREQRKFAERDDFVRKQLEDLTNFLRDQLGVLETKSLTDSRHEEK